MIPQILSDTMIELLYVPKDIHEGSIILMILLIGAIYKLLKKEVGTRSYTEKVSSNTFPSIAMCPYTYSPMVNWSPENALCVHQYKSANCFTICV